MSAMSAVVLCPVPSPAAAALIAALSAGLGAVREAATPDAAAAACRAEPRSIVVIDLRDPGAAAGVDCRRLRRLLPGTRLLALLGPGVAPPPECDSVLTAPFYLVEVVKWCARATVEPLAEGLLADLAAGLSHEIGNPLTALLLQIEMLKSDDRIAGIREHLQLIEDSSRRIQDVVRDVTLATDRLPIVRVASRLADVLADARQLLAERSAALAARLSIACEDQPVRVQVDLLATALADLWQYLLLAGEPGDALAVEAGALDELSLSIRMRATVPRLPADAAGRLFTPLWARQALGLPGGLSLSSARAAFLRHGGELRARQQRGGSLTVEALLPREEQAALWPVASPA